MNFCKIYSLICLIILVIKFVSSKYSSESSEESGDQKLCKFIDNLLASKKHHGHLYYSQTNASKAIESVIKLVSQRLDLAKSVALYKWQSNQSINDPVREASLLASVASQANASGLALDLAKQFFQDQINASKVIQFAYFALWTAHGAPNVMAPDLSTVTRPQINNVTSALVQALAPVQTIRLSRKCPQQAEKGLQRLVHSKEITANPEAFRSDSLCAGLDHLCADNEAF